jgi:cytidylate kinase
MGGSRLTGGSLVESPIPAASPRFRVPASSSDHATLVVAVDGPSGSGKSSVSRGVARRLGLRYLDTGSMYRAMAWWMTENGIDPTDEGAVAAACGRPRIEVGTDPAAPTIEVDGRDVSGPIRTREVTAVVSPVSAVRAVRDRLVALQREVIGSGGIVVEGRDIGTVVSADAAVKIYLTAHPEVRAVRRAAELSADPAAEAQRTLSELRRRDAIDSQREASPLAKADDAVEIDATDLTLEQVIDAVLDVVRARTGASR